MSSSDASVYHYHASQDRQTRFNDSAAAIPTVATGGSDSDPGIAIPER